VAVPLQLSAGLSAGREEATARGAMPIIYSLVSRGTCVLAEFTATSGNFTTVTRRILEKLPRTDSRMSYVYDRHVFHYIVSGGLVYMCMADEPFGRRLPFVFLEDIIRKWTLRFGDSGATAVAYFMNEDFSGVLQQQMAYYTERGTEAVTRVAGEIEEVRMVMVENIERVLERGEKIELLVDKTETLNHQAFKFRKQARSVRRFMWMKNMKVLAFGLYLVVLAGFVISLLICGIDYGRCRSDDDGGGGGHHPAPSLSPFLPPPLPPSTPPTNMSLLQ